MISQHSSNISDRSGAPKEAGKAMTNRKLEPMKSARRRLEVEKSLADYPDLSPDEIINIVHWFKNEASSFEVASVASNSEIQEEYSQFRNLYLAKLTPWEIGLACLFGAILLTFLTALVILP
jgi:hypothetical protein